MKVKELIEKLSSQDPELRVVVNGYECGFDEIDKICLIKMILNPNKGEKHWEGEFDEVYGEGSSEEVEAALCFPRKS
jgi:hypothetical protein